MKNSKKQFSIQNQSFLTLLIRSYVLFSLLTVIIISSIFTLATILLNEKNLAWQGLDISNYEPELISKQYEKLPIRTIAGNGFVQIYDYKGDLLYSSTENKINFKRGELDIMPNYKRHETIEIHSFETELGDTQYFIHLTPNTPSYQGDNKYLVLSDTYKILETNLIINKKSLTKNEFDIISFNANNKETLTKYEFTANDDNTYTAVVYDTTLRRNKTPIYIIVISGVLMIVIYIVLLTANIKFILKILRQPLLKIEVGMYKYSIGNYNERLDRTGPKELADISTGFNQMVDVIEKNQKENQRLQDERNRFLAGLSHDLKTPITVIQGFAKALNDGIVKDKKEQQIYLKTIQEKSEHMATLINKMYDYSKLDHPDFALRFKNIDILEFTRQYFALKYDTFEINGYNLDIDIPESSQILPIDDQEFPRVYDNIISNFEKYAPKGSTFKISIDLNDHEVNIYLGDNGTPIPDEYRSNIFDSFAVADPARNNKGTGLGLAIIKKIVDLHHASIELISQGEFTNTFKITFLLN